MSEGNEGVPVPEAAKVELDKYGQIKGMEISEKAATPFVDSDDRPENQGMTPTQNIANLRERLAKSTPVVDAKNIAPTSQAPKGTAK